MRMNLSGDPAVLHMAEILGIDDPDLIVGKLHRLWSWASEHTTDGNAHGVTEKSIDYMLRVTGFAKALHAAGWLILENGGINIPKFEKYLSEGSKSRALTALRVKEHREKHKENVTPEALQNEDEVVTPSSSSSYIKKGGAGGKQSRKPKAPNYDPAFIGTEPQPGDGVLPPALVALFQSQGKEEAYKNVWMTEAQFDALTKRFGEDRVNWAGQQLVDWSLSLEVSNKTNLAGWQSYRAKRDHAGCIRNQILRRWPELGGEDGKGL